MSTSFYTQEELAGLGFARVGVNCLISRKASFYNCGDISLGDNVRIDDFCLLSGKISLGSNIHISAYAALYGGNYGIRLEDYTGISARTTLYAAMDDFSGDYLVGPVHPESKTHVTGKEIILRQYAQIGAHCLVFPGVEIGEGTVVGACSMVRDSLRPWSVYWGVPAVWRKERSRKLVDLVQR